jgi:hypothetical protein
LAKFKADFEARNAPAGEPPPAAEAPEGGAAEAPAAPPSDRLELPPLKPKAGGEAQALDAKLLDRIEKLERGVPSGAVSDEIKDLRELRDRLKADPYAVVQEYGGSLTDWSTKVLAGSADPAVEKLEKELADLRKWREEQEKGAKANAEAAQQREFQEAVTAIKADISKTLEKPEYQFVKVAKLEQEVYNVVEAHARRTLEAYGTAEMMPYEEAAKLVRDHYKPRIRQQIEALRATPEFADLFVPATRSAAPPAPTEPRSLSARQVAGSPSRADNPRLSPEERKARLLAGLSGG